VGWDLCKTDSITEGRLILDPRADKPPNVTFHDPCYLGRHNDIIEAPRNVLMAANGEYTEMPRSKKNSFCCGAGGGQFWKEEEHGAKAVNVERYEEAAAAGADVVAVGCPFCMQMFETAKSAVPNGPDVKDVADLIAERLGETPQVAEVDATG
jgi:Fe-S oxidoreductase